MAEVKAGHVYLCQVSDSGNVCDSIWQVKCRSSEVECH